MGNVTRRAAKRLAILVGAALATMAMLAPLPTRAAEAPAPSNSLLLVHPPAGYATWDNSFPSRAPRTERQRETAQVQQMSRTLMRSNGAVFAGEDALGAGTSLTH